jgi:Tol biopolymer transport system component
VVFIRAREGSGRLSDIYVQPLTGNKPTQVTFDHRQLAGMAWTADGRILYSSDRDGEYKL